jgi:hypothetical protein
MSRAPKHIETEEVTEVILRIIAAHRGKPCPTQREIIDWTGLPRTRVWPFLRALAMRQPPLIELDERVHARAGMRRLRLPGGQWTGWTQRRTPTLRDQAMKQRHE